MILFHTGSSIIRTPDIHIGRSNTDFGRGFYLTPNEGFGGSWAREREASSVYMNKYELNMDGLSVKVFSKNVEWYDYIFRNRRGLPDDLKDHDVIIGPIAVDTLFETYGIITSGLLTRDQALELLRIGPEYTQAAIKTQRGVDALTWIGAVNPDETSVSAAASRYKEEKAVFEAQFAAALEKMI